MSEKLLLSITETQEMLGLGRSLLMEMLLDGRIASLKIGRRRLVTRAAIDAYIAGLVEDQLGDAEPRRVPIEA